MPDPLHTMPEDPPGDGNLPPKQIASEISQALKQLEEPGLLPRDRPGFTRSEVSLGVADLARPQPYEPSVIMQDEYAAPIWIMKPTPVEEPPLGEENIIPWRTLRYDLDSIMIFYEQKTESKFVGAPPVLWEGSVRELLQVLRDHPSPKPELSED